MRALGRHVLGGSRDRADESRRRIRDGDRAPRTRGQPLIHPGGATIGRESSGRGDAPARLLPRSERRGSGRRGRRESGRRRPSCLGFFLRRFVRRRRRALWPLGRVVWWKRPTGRRAVVRPRRRFLVGCNRKCAVGQGDENQKARKRGPTRKRIAHAPRPGCWGRWRRATPPRGAFTAPRRRTKTAFGGATRGRRSSSRRRRGSARRTSRATCRRIPRPESRCVAGTTWSGSRGACVADAIDARYAHAASTGGGGGFDFRAHFPAVLSLLLAFSVCVVVVATSLLLAFALARAGSRALARGARRIKKIARRVEDDMTRKMKETDDTARSRRAGYAAAAATIGALAEICARLLGWIHDGLDETYARTAHASRTHASHARQQHGRSHSRGRARRHRGRGARGHVPQAAKEGWTPRGSDRARPRWRVPWRDASFRADDGAHGAGRGGGGGGGGER